MKKKFIYIIFTLLFFIINFYIIGNAAINKILKAEIYYISIDTSGKPININFVSIFKWIRYKTLVLKKRIKIPNKLKSTYVKENIYQTDEKINFKFNQSSHLFLREQLNKNFPLPVKIEVSYYFNDKKVKPIFAFNKAGKLTIVFKITNLRKRKVNVKYKNFPDNRELSRETEIFFPYVVMIQSSAFKIVQFDDVEVEGGVKSIFSENYIISGFAFPYPDALIKVTFIGKIKYLPSFQITVVPFSYSIPSIVTKMIGETEKNISTTYKSYILMKNSLLEIIKIEEEIIKNIDTFLDKLKEFYPMLSEFQDLIYFYISNLEKVQKLNNIFIETMYKLKNYLNINDYILDEIKKLFNLNNQLINFVLSGYVNNGEKIPGLYQFPELITQGEETTATIENALYTFREGSVQIKNLLKKSGNILQKYEKEIIDVVNKLRFETAKVEKIFDFSDIDLDYALEIENVDPQKVPIEKSVQFIYKLNFH